jgi:hypothetical protein
MNIEHNTPRPRVPWMAILILLGWLIVIAGIIHTATSFTPRYEAVMADLADMQDKLDAMGAELEGMKD